MGLFGFLNKKPIPKLNVAEQKFHSILDKKIPEGAIPYAMELWKKHPFSFRMPKTRKTCLGNFIQKNGHHTITVNSDLNPYAFLITLIHEIAHHRIALENSLLNKHVDPHGNEWKHMFSTLMMPVLELENVFPEPLRSILKMHMKNPAASSTRDPKLVKALKQYDEIQKNPGTILAHVPAGKTIVFNTRSFLKIENRRTRTLVEDPKTKKRYTIPSFVEVEVISA
ncbi:MAG: SprT-like domain-containing protein [Leadbetterella sp.]